MSTPALTCPKRMVFGPCGGVRPDGGCEMAAMPCVFPEPVLPQTVSAARPLERVPLVLTDFSTPPFDRRAVARTCTLLAGSCDAVLVGEHQDRPDYPPTLFAELLLENGCRPWVTLACRDRNRIVFEQELRGLQPVGADAVLCVTGDGRAYDVRPEVTQVFDLDGPRLAMLAAEIGISAAVSETPTAPPLALRPQRLVAKQQCGAAVAAVLHGPARPRARLGSGAAGACGRRPAPRRRRRRRGRRPATCSRSTASSSSSSSG